MTAIARQSLLVESLLGSVVGLDVPFERQSTGYSCGAASLAAVLRYWNVGAPSGDLDLVSALGTNSKNGTQSERIVELARRYGLSARTTSGSKLSDLRTALAAGIAPVLNFQAWPSRRTAQLTSRVDGHYAVLVAMDDNRVYLMDPALLRGRVGWIPLDEFQRAWRGTRSLRQAILIRGVRHRGRVALPISARIETGR